MLSLLRFSCFVGFSLEGYLKEQGLNAVDQIKGLALDKLKEALGLPTYLIDPPCSLTGAKYVPNTNGVKKGTKPVEHFTETTVSRYMYE